mmetsp:Transcript_9318/g.10625  ORF Transcript_9318/g.10625 Transcript_9318/m.10625 type:complete len:134 (+) Transcript_9318:129-530(+)
MASFLLLKLVCFLSIICGTSAIKALSQTNFSSFLERSTTGVFVNFYSPYCGHCQKLHPIWTKLAERHDREDSVDIVEVDCIRNSDLCDAHGILGYPTMKFFQVGSTEGKEFEGRRDVTSLENFMEQCNSEAFS